MVNINMTQGQLDNVVTAINNRAKTSVVETKTSAMSKAQFNALAEERKANRAGSGFDEWGLHRSEISTFPNVNQGIWVSSDYSNYFVIGRDSSSAGVSKTKYPIINVNGIIHRIESINSIGIVQSHIQLPIAPTIYPHDTVLTTEQINSGVIKHADSSNSGLVQNGKGLSGTTFTQTVITVNGKKYTIEYVDNSIRKTLEITATVTTYNISLSGTNITEVGMYPNDAISRSDLVFLESWHEDIAEKNIVYPLGNVQYLGSNTDGLTGIANGSFSGFETYSLSGLWQTSSSLIGKGYVWSSLTESQRKAFISNPDNNCYLDGDKVIQVRYRCRVLMGEDTNSMAKATVQGKSVVPSSVLYTAPVTTVDAGLYSNTSTTYGYDGKVNAISIANIQRPNFGMYHPIYNPNGSRKASDDKYWYETSVSFTSISDCFNSDKILANSGTIASGKNGRPDNRYADQIHESDITDLRNSSKKVEDYNRLMTREFNKLVAGTYRGKEGEWSIVKTHSATPVSKGSTGINLYVEFAVNTMPIQLGSNAGSSDISYGVFIDASGNLFKVRGTHPSLSQSVYLQAYYGSNLATINIAGSCTVILTNNTTRTKSNTLLHCDIIGNPTNYPTAWKQSGVFGTPLIVAEDGTSLLPDGTRDIFKLSRKANATPLLCLRSTDGGATWTSFTPTFSTTTNAITLTDEPANNLVMVYYQTKTSMAVPAVNSEVLELGNVAILSSHNSSNYVFSLIGKVSTNITSPTTLTNLSKTYFHTYQNKLDAGILPTTSNFVIGWSTQTPAVKVFPYLTRTNGKAFMNLVFKEMKHNGTSWGDDNKFNIVDNVSTTTDNNAQTVLIGQKTVELPYFIGADE